MTYHVFCIACWQRLYASKDIPTGNRVIPAQPAKGVIASCCECGILTGSGIRHLEERRKCKQDHEDYAHIVKEKKKQRPKYQRFTWEEMDEVINLLKADVRAVDIARMKNVNVDRIYQIQSELRRRGWRFGSIATHAKGAA